MKLFIVLAAVVASSCAISFFDLVLEEWGTYKVSRNWNVIHEAADISHAFYFYIFALHLTLFNRSLMVNLMKMLLRKNSG